MKVRVPKDFGGGSQQQMLKKFSKMQEDMAAKTEELEAKIYDIAVGGGAVSLKISGKKEITELNISPEIVDPDDIETLSDLLCAAFNEAITVVEKDSAEEMEKITGQVQLPNIPGLSF
ncbi:MAG: YbaB/EbfC family nucleoid-associated protein [Ruminococcaceae bacterium]|nr:YbaB/EbfC family nucleoid-associated protein [Oscillospiraceae bacterium]